MASGCGFLGQTSGMGIERAPSEQPWTDDVAAKALKPVGKLCIGGVVADAVAEFAFVAESGGKPVFHEEAGEAGGDIEIILVGHEAFDSVGAIDFGKLRLEMRAFGWKLVDPGEFEIMGPFVVNEDGAFGNF